MPSYLDFESSRNGKSIPDSQTGFRDYLLAKTLKRPNGPQTFTATNYVEQSLSELPNKDVGGIDNSENFNLNNSLVKTSSTNTYKPINFLVKDTFVTLPRAKNLNLYPYFESSKHTLIGIMLGAIDRKESDMIQFAENYIKNDRNGPVFARLARNIDTNINGKNRLLDALNGNTATAINLVTGREPLIEFNNSITVAKTLIGKGIDFLEKVAGVTAPFSEIPGDYLTNPLHPVNYRQTINPKTGQPVNQTQSNKLWQDITGAIGSLIGIQRRPNFTRKPSDLMIEYLGEGQKMRLYNALTFNTYSPNYTTSAMSQNSSKIFNFIDKVSSFGKKLIGQEAPNGAGVYDKNGKLVGRRTAYIGDDRGEDVKHAMSDFYSIMYKSPYYLSQMFDSIPGGGYYDGTDLFHKNKEILWTKTSGLTDGSADMNFRPDSLLDYTQFIVGLSSKDGEDHVSRAIDQTSKYFVDGDKKFSKGSGVKLLLNKSSDVIGAEYGRVWTKTNGYNSLDKTMKQGSNIRKFEGSVMGGKSRVWNLNIAPMSNGKKSFQGSTNIFERTDGAKDFYAKKYMFSIENLAWKTSTMPGFTYDSLPACERGNNFGRVMWFPPYGLTISEQNNAKWEENTFLGRPEPIYTYQNTSRGGQLKFKIVVDHPSILNLLVREHFKDMTDEQAEAHILAFFAGTETFDFYELIKTYTTLDVNDVGLIKAFMNARNKPDKTTIAKYSYTSEPVPTDNPSKPSNTKPGTPIKASFYFENDVPGKFSEKKSTSDFTYAQLYAPYLNKKDQYQTDLATDLNQLLTGTTAEYKADVKIIFGNDVKPAEKTTAIAKRVESVGKIFDKMRDDFAGLNTSLADLKKQISGNTVDDVTIVVESSTSEVGEDSPNFYLGVRRAHSIAKTVFEGLTAPGTKIDFLKWPSASDLKTNSKTGTEFLKKEYPLSSFGWKENKGKLTLSFKSYGEDFKSGDFSCKQVIKTKFGLKKTAPIAVGCRTGSVKINFNVKNNPTTPIVPQKIKIRVDEIPLVPTPKPTIDVMKRIIMKTLGECYYFKKLEDTDPLVFNALRDKLKYFHPAFHSTTPEGLNTRLTFLLQCVRPGDTIPIKGLTDELDKNARNTTFGPPPICVLRIGDFYHSKIIIRDVNIDYEDGLWDMNPEGIGVQPMIANVSLSISFIGGQGLEKPVERLQNALSSNFFANTEMYDERATSTNTIIDGKKAEDFEYEFLKELEKKPEYQLVDDADKGNNVFEGKTVGQTNGDKLDYTWLVDRIYSYSSIYTTVVISAYEKMVKDYGFKIANPFFNPTIRSINQYDIQTPSGTTPISFIGLHPKGSDIQTTILKIKTAVLDAVESYKLSLDILKLLDNEFDGPVTELETALKPLVKKIISDKLDAISSIDALKEIDSKRNAVTGDFDYMNYVIKYEKDGFITGTTYNDVSLNGFTKADLFGAYSSMVGYLIDFNHNITQSLDTSLNFMAIQGLPIEEAKEIIPYLIKDDEKKIIEELKKEDILSIGDSNGTPYIEKITINLYSQSPKPITDFKYAKKITEVKRKSTLKFQYVKGVVEEIASEDPDGKKPILNNLWINKNIEPTGTKLNYYKKKG